MRHYPSVDQVKADILSVFKNITEDENEQKMRTEAERHRRARQTIEDLQEKKRLEQELSNGWDLELH
ncbi:PA3496 family putative envelope integrity protein [Marinospirillum perlucidum]|uniref:PA3496 family putative envelope integrity protein n=1 Tax=Marinospirillum perlucidum TaxID=1982602 RepID=UPI000DF1FA0C|nr:hypothetical protein [Marinospirillum perlucidum]